MKESDLIQHLISKQYTTEKIMQFVLRFREKTLKPRESFADYVKLMFSETVANCTFNESQHTKALIEILQLRADGKLLNKNVIISIPPGHTKTLLCNILYCSWILGKYPHLRLLLGTNSQTEGNKRNLELRDLMQSEKYKNIFPDVFLTGEDVKWLKTNHKGGRLAVTTDVAMRFTGTDADELIIDDPNDTTSTIIEFEKVKDWFDKKAKRRLRRGNLGLLCIMQRVGLQDLTEHLLKNQQDILHIVLPAESENDYFLNIPLKDGSIHQIKILQGYLWKDKDVVKMYEDAKRNQLIWQTQYQQNPINFNGTYIKEEYIMKYNGTKYQEIIFKEIFMTCDLAVKTGEKNDYTVVVLFGIMPNGRLFVIDILRGKWDTDRTKQIVNFWFSWQNRIKHVNSPVIHIEDAAGGHDLANHLKMYYKIPVRLITRTKDLETRIEAVMGFIESKTLWMPYNLAHFNKPDLMNEVYHEITSFVRLENKRDRRTGHDDVLSCIIDGLQYYKDKYYKIHMEYVGMNTSVEE